LVNLFADPPQGRDDSQQLRTTGRFSIPLIAPPQGIGISEIPISPMSWIDDLNNQFVTDEFKVLVFEP